MRKRLRAIRKGSADVNEAGKVYHMVVGNCKKSSCSAKTYILHNYIFLLAVYLLF